MKFSAITGWLACLGAALVTIIPLGAMGLMSIFDSSFTTVARLQGFGFFVLALLTVAVLGLTASRISLTFSKAARAQNR